MKPKERKRALWVVQTTNLYRPPIKLKCMVKPGLVQDVATSVEPFPSPWGPKRRFIVGVTAFSRWHDAQHERMTRIFYRVQDDYLKSNKYFTWTQLRFQLLEWQQAHPKWEPGPKRTRVKRPKRPGRLVEPPECIPPLDFTPLEPPPPLRVNIATATITADMIAAGTISQALLAPLPVPNYTRPGDPVVLQNIPQGVIHANPNEADALLDPAPQVA